MEPLKHFDQLISETTEIPAHESLQSAPTTAGSAAGVFTQAIAAVVLIALLLGLSAARADIYRYRDAQGGWHFTDDPPPGAELVPGYARKEEKKEEAERRTSDLTAQLERGFDAVTPIARATLSVVSIKTSSGEGSGFFCTNEGYILTNRHVIRPSEGSRFQGRDETLADQERELAALERQLEQGQTTLSLMEKDLEGYERVIERARDASAQGWATKSRDRLREQYRTEKAKSEEAEKKLRTIKRDLKRKRRDLNLERSSEAVANVFEVILKDEQFVLDARLVDTSASQDLALLKLDGFRTPFMRLDHRLSLSQGQRVFAIGNPLGMHDSVTSGVITRMTPEYVHTDVQILPGNSGGPLITENGEVIGINVAKDVAEGDSMYGVGFGKAIPIDLAVEAFSEVLGTPDKGRP